MNIIKKYSSVDFNSLSVKDNEEILNEMRKQVDEIDKQLVELLIRRTSFSLLIGRIKRSLSLPTYSPERERDINKKITTYLKKPLNKISLARIYERILDQSRAIQREEALKGNIYNLDE
jgi:chorismate mutase